MINLPQLIELKLRIICDILWLLFPFKSPDIKYYLSLLIEALEHSLLSFNP